MVGPTLSPELQRALVAILRELGRPTTTEELVRLLRQRREAENENR
ncbi:MAG: hypothetical protein NZ696_01995 [Thermomicrobium sp.]|nr:hypothetical protein [Thermomicrobium sp.]MDW7982387.1 hypothetical protein [Thermomicrobium sp.]